MFVLRAAILALVLGSSAATLRGRKLQSFTPIAGYAPGSNVDDHNIIDQDQAAIQAFVGEFDQNGFDKALRVYTLGGHSKTIATVNLDPALGTSVAAGTTATGTAVDGSTVTATVVIDAVQGDTTLTLQYQFNVNGVNCHVGGLSDEFVMNSGCLGANGSIQIGSASVAYFYDISAGNTNGRTIQGFSTSADEKMLNCPIGCPYPDFLKFYNYYGRADYANEWILAAFEGRMTILSNGTTDFSLRSTSDFNLRAEAIQKGTAYMAVWMYVIREFEDALDDCTQGSITDNDDSVHAWDEGVAFYTGSAVGTQLNSVMGGNMPYTLANKRCANFKTCGPNNNQVTGNANINIRLFDLFTKGKTEVKNGNCNAGRVAKDKITPLMAVPLVQGTLRYAYIIGKEGNRSPKSFGEGAVFAASVLPIVHDCSAEDAEIIFTSMNANAASTDFAAVKAAFERNYECMGITCADVGGYFNDATNGYYPMAEPCVDGYTPIAGYVPSSDVEGHAALDLDQMALENELDKKSIGGIMAAAEIYKNGGFSKSFAVLQLNNTLGTAVSKGYAVDGLTTSGALVQGMVFSSVLSNSRSIVVQYETGTRCHVGGLLAGVRNLEGCLAPTGTIQVENVGLLAYHYDPTTANGNDRTLQGFSIHALENFLTCDEGCPYSHFEKFFNYYGVADYGDRWISSAVEGTATNSFTNGFADFSGSAIELRVEAIQKGSAYMNVWISAISEFEHALDHCIKGKIANNDEATHAWDEGVAFYTGSLVGTEADSVVEGVFPYTLANKRCANFKTCGRHGKDLSGNSYVNRQVFHYFNEGKRHIERGQCGDALRSWRRLNPYMTVPLVQGTLRYAYKLGEQGDRSKKSVGEGAVFAASVLPLVHACKPEDAQIIYDNMKVTADGVDFLAVKEAFERNYDCLEISCSEVGGYYDADNDRYYPNADPCRGWYLNDGAIAGIVLGSLFLLLVILSPLCWQFFCGRKGVNAVREMQSMRARTARNQQVALLTTPEAEIS